MRLVEAVASGPSPGRAAASSTGWARLLRSAVFRAVMLAVALLGLAAAGIVAAIGWSAGRDLVTATERVIAQDLGQLRQIHRSGGPDALTSAVAERSRSDGPMLFFLGPRSGQKRAGNLAALPASLASGDAGGTFAYPARGGGSRSAAGVLIELDGGVVLVVAHDIEEQRGLLSALRRGLIWGLGALSVLGLGAGLLLARHILGRIDAISATAGAIMAGDLSGRVSVRGTDDELDRLSGELNAMLARIEQLMAGLREVSDNIAHDLKTPLNRLRNTAEAALADTRGGPAWREGLEQTIAGADELIKTFNALLLIARLEAGAVDGASAVLDAGEVAAEVADLYEPSAEDAGFSLEVDAGGPAPVRANRHLLAQALANLIENAIKYSGAGAAGGPRDISIRVRALEATVELSVGDRGPGIAPEHRERALRRFGRLDDSRTLPGTGLGLSLVAAVARMHGGSLRLDDNRPGLLVVLSLPRAISSEMGRS